MMNEARDPRRPTQDLRKHYFCSVRLPLAHTVDMPHMPYYRPYYDHKPHQREFLFTINRFGTPSDNLGFIKRL